MTICWKKVQAPQHHSWSLPTEVYTVWDRDNPRRRSPQCVSLDAALSHVVNGTKYELCECTDRCPHRRRCYQR